MFLLLYIGDQLVDQTFLSHRAMQDESLRVAYVQGAINEMLEKWEKLVRESDQEPRFYIKNPYQNTPGHDQAH